MEKIYILCVEDIREVLNAILQDLEPLGAYFILEGCESALEAGDLLEEIDANGDFVGLFVCDHVMPEKSGVEFLTEVNRDSRFKNSKKLLLTGLATHQDTIEAINKAGIDRYIEKPWDAEMLVQQARELLTRFILDEGLLYEKYLPILDAQVLLDRIRK